MRRSAFREDRPGRLCKALNRAKVNHANKNPETALQELAPSDPPEWLSTAEPEEFIFPLPAAPERIAVIGGGFRRAKNIRFFEDIESAALSKWMPEVVAAPLDAALSMAEMRLAGLELPVTMAIMVLTALGGGALEERHRDMLWRAFGVPVFEQLRAWEGTVIARECEVHDGLHLVENAVIMHVHEGELLATLLTATETPVLRARTGFCGDITRENCECGAETPRLRNLSVIGPRATVTAA